MVYPAGPVPFGSLLQLPLSFSRSASRRAGDSRPCGLLGSSGCRWARVASHASANLTSAGRHGSPCSQGQVGRLVPKVPRHSIGFCGRDLAWPWRRFGDNAQWLGRPLSAAMGPWHLSARSSWDTTGIGIGNPLATGGAGRSPHAPQAGKIAAPRPTWPCGS